MIYTTEGSENAWLVCDVCGARGQESGNAGVWSRGIADTNGAIHGWSCRMNYGVRKDVCWDCVQKGRNMSVIQDAKSFVDEVETELGKSDYLNNSEIQERNLTAQLHIINLLAELLIRTPDRN